MFRTRLLAVPVLAFALFHCVGSDTDPATTPQADHGAQGQPCYDNGTCLVGLACVAATCVPADAGTIDRGPTAENDGGPTDAGVTLDAPDATDAPDANLESAFSQHFSSQNEIGTWVESGSGTTGYDATEGKPGSNGALQSGLPATGAAAEARLKHDFAITGSGTLRASVLLFTVPGGAAPVTLLELSFGSGTSDLAIRILPSSGLLSLVRAGITSATAMSSTPQSNASDWMDFRLDIDVGAHKLTVASGTNTIFSGTDVMFSNVSIPTSATIFVGLEHDAEASAPSMGAYFDEASWTPGAQ